MKALKFFDLVKFKTAQFMYHINNNKCPVRIQALFQKREMVYNFRGGEKLKKNKLLRQM